jgi:hypothetical protein
MCNNVLGHQSNNLRVDALYIGEEVPVVAQDVPAASWSLSPLPSCQRVEAENMWLTVSDKRAVISNVGLVPSMSGIAHASQDRESQLFAAEA